MLTKSGKQCNKHGACVLVNDQYFLILWKIFEQHLYLTGNLLSEHFKVALLKLFVICYYFSLLIRCTWKPKIWSKTWKILFYFSKKKKKKTRTGFLGPVIVFVLPLLIRFFFSLFYSDEWVNIWEFSQVFKICIFILVVLFYNCASHHFLICSS